MAGLGGAHPGGGPLPGVGEALRRAPDDGPGGLGHLLLGVPPETLQLRASAACRRPGSGRARGSPGSCSAPSLAAPDGSAPGPRAPGRHARRQEGPTRR